MFYNLMAGFTLGLLGQIFYQFTAPTLLWFSLLSLFAAIVAWREKAGGRQAARFFLFLSLFITLFVLGALRVYLAEATNIVSPLATQVGQPVEIIGKVAREPDVRERSLQLFVEIGEELILVRTERYQAVSYGDIVSVSGRLEKPEPFETDLGRTFNYPGYLKAQGVGYLISFASIEVLESGRGHLILTLLFRFKHSFMSNIESLIPEPQVGLGEGLLLGVKQALGRELEIAFRQTGIIHIVVLSGYNVMLVVLFVTYVFAFLFGLRLRIIFGLLAITGFALMVGLSATVARASLMAGLALLALAFGRTYEVTRALFLAGAVMLIFNPYLIAYDVGFQLSFLATLGLILLAPHIEGRLALTPTLFGIREFVTATVATQIFVLPLLLYQIGEFSVVAVAVNVLVLPMVAVAMLLTFAAGLLAYLSFTLAGPMAFLAHLSLTYIIVICEGFADLPFAAFLVPAFPFWLVPLAYAGLGYWLWLRRDSIPTTDRYGDIAERLFHRLLPSAKNSRLAGWTIEEVTTVKVRSTAYKETIIKQTELPKFFR